MNTDIQLISDGDGLAVIGDPAAVERFLVAEGLPSKDLGLQRLRTVARAGSAMAQAGSELASNSGRWVQLSSDSAKLAAKYPMVTNSSTGLSTGVLRGDNGQFVGMLQFAKDSGSLGSMLANPAILAGAAGIMAQVAMQQAMDEITEYLKTIDEKLDDVLRAQKDAVLADMIGVHLMIEEAMTVRDHMGRVSEVTWSKVQATPSTIARTQAYAIRQLDALAEKLERKSQIGDVAKAAKEAEAKIQEWLAVLARCFRLQDAIAVLELDRVLDTSPDDLDRHRLALQAARRNRLQLITRSTENLLARIAAAARNANTKVLLHPMDSRAVVHSSNQVTGAVVDFHGVLGIDGGQQALEAKRWVVAATEAKDKALETGADGVDTALRVSNETFTRAKSLTDKFSTRLTERALRRRGDDGNETDAAAAADDEFTHGEPSHD